MEKEPSFEEALKRLEDIVSSLETGSLTLDESLGKFEEGVKLSRLCNKKLKETQQKVEKLVQKDNDILTEPITTE
ncbi:MAG: exodeoxyribonuclease VII small subunit [Thermoplasmata archaeon]|nr:MAG: exodeoxyribonuclease VII small subunit [Thermoplasmata archaeon]